MRSALRSQDWERGRGEGFANTKGRNKRFVIEAFAADLVFWRNCSLRGFRIQVDVAVVVVEQAAGQGRKARIQVVAAQQVAVQAVAVAF